MPAKKNIKDLTLDELKVELQVFSWLYRKGKTTFGEFSDLSKRLREKLETDYFISRMDAVERRRSPDGTEKFLFRLSDGNFIETVLIPSGRRRTVCLSTQAGCKFACVFCASGLNGFKRNLSPSEITGQVLFLRDTLGRELTNLVFMGMGEPLDNLRNLEKAVRIMNSPEGMAIAARRMTISTCGLVPGIQRLAKIDLQVNLSLSLHAATDSVRDKLMPVNKKYPLEKVVEACEEYLKSGGRMLTIEYILIKGVNDSLSDAEGLAGIARRLRAKVNVITCSPVAGLVYQGPREPETRMFIQWLEERKVQVTRRRSKGADIAAACGQLAGRAQSAGRHS